MNAGVFQVAVVRISRADLKRLKDSMDIILAKGDKTKNVLCTIDSSEAEFRILWSEEDLSLAFREKETQKLAEKKKEKEEMTQEENDPQSAAMNEHYELYSKIRKGYEDLIQVEYDPQRKVLLEKMLEDLNEENK